MTSRYPRLFVCACHLKLGDRGYCIWQALTCISFSEHGARELAGVAVSTLRDVVRQMLLSHSVDESAWAKVRMAAYVKSIVKYNI